MTADLAAWPVGIEGWPSAPGDSSLGPLALSRPLSSAARHLWRQHPARRAGAATGHGTTPTAREGVHPLPVAVRGPGVPARVLTSTAPRAVPCAAQQGGDSCAGEHGAKPSQGAATAVQAGHRHDTRTHKRGHRRKPRPRPRPRPTGSQLPSQTGQDSARRRAAAASLLRTRRRLSQRTADSGQRTADSGQRTADRHIAGLLHRRRPDDRAPAAPAVVRQPATECAAVQADTDGTSLAPSPPQSRSTPPQRHAGGRQRREWPSQRDPVDGPGEKLGTGAALPPRRSGRPPHPTS